ncbi:MAG: O-antigen ligase family protein [Pirellulales bacterium]|nr:O-antigen ligase family protein [Pirellulales bacterium]
MSNPASHRLDVAANWPVRFVIALGLAFVFTLVAHSWHASASLVEYSGKGAHERENRFAQQQATTTSSSAIGFFLLGGMGLAFAAVAPTLRLRWLHPVAILFVAYLGWCLASVAWTDSRFLTSRKLAILLLIVTAAYGTATKASLQDLLWGTALYFLGTIIAGGLAELSLGTFRPWRSDYRFAGTTDPNGLGLESAALTLISGFLQFPRRDRPQLRYGLTAIGLAALALTKSRTALAALVVATLVGLVLRVRGQQRFLVVSGLIAAGCVAGLLASFVSVAAIKESANVASMGRQEHVSSLTGRTPLWRAVIQEAERKPVSGHGYGAFWTDARIYKYSEMFRWQIPHAHNTYIDLVLATGVVGLGLYVLWALALAFAGMWRYQAVGAPGDLLVTCFVVFTLVHGCAESKIPSAGATTFLLFALGAATALKPATGPSVALSLETPRPRAPDLSWRPSRRSPA